MYGIAKTIENLGYIVLPLLFGFLADETGSYMAGCSLFAGMGLLSLFAMLAVTAISVIELRRNKAAEQPDTDEIAATHS